MTTSIFIYRFLVFLVVLFQTVQALVTTPRSLVLQMKSRPVKTGFSSRTNRLSYPWKSPVQHSLTSNHDNRQELPQRNKNRLRKRWLWIILLLAAAIFLPTRSASASSILLTDTATEIAATSTYHSNAPMSFLTVTSPLSHQAEFRLTLRLIFAAAAGAAVGMERSSTGHPGGAGVRTMALVALGAAAFTLCSMYGFSTAGRYDPSRMASNVASGVGFIGAGVITTSRQGENGSSESVVHGLTTAAAIWLSAAMGVAAGVGMLVTSGTVALSTVVILRLNRVKESLNKTLKNGYSVLGGSDHQLVFRRRPRRSHWNETDHTTTQ